MRNLAIVVFAICLAIIFLDGAHLIAHPPLNDFAVYDTAAYLAAHQHSDLIYEGADTGRDPQQLFAEKGSQFALAAGQLGIRKVRLYIYPPLLADLMLPLSLVSANIGGKIWILLMVLLAVSSGLMVSRLQGNKTLSLESVVYGIGAIAFAIKAISDGQVTIVLLFLWTLGIYSFARRRTPLSAFAFAVATVLKLTPVLVVIPFFCWRKWKWLLCYAISLAGIAAAMLMGNGTAWPRSFFLKIVPAMSNGFPITMNKSLFSSLQNLYWANRGYKVEADPLPVAPPYINLLAKLIAIAVLGITAYLLLRAGRKLELIRPELALASIALLSVCLSPVSWEAAYVQAFPLVAFLWPQAFQEGARKWKFWFLCFVSLELTTFHFEGLHHLIHSQMFAAALIATAPLTGIAVSLLGLYWSMPRFQLKAEQQPVCRA